MQKLLSIVLSFSILFSSVAPSFANVPVRAVRGALSGTAAKSAVKTNVSSSLRSSVLREVVRKNTLSAAALGTVDASAISATQALSLSSEMLGANASAQAAKVQQEWLGLAVNFEDVFQSHAAAAAAVLTEDLIKKQPIFAQIPHRNLQSFLNTAMQANPTPAINDIADALADASAIALVGSSEQIPVLLSFYKAAHGSVFENTAAVIVARGLLRYGAYEELNAFLLETGDLGAFTEGLAQYAEQNNLPVIINKTAAQAQEVPSELHHFLEKRGAIHGLHADPSYDATCAWMSLGKPAPETAPVLKPISAPVKGLTVAPVKISVNLPVPEQITLVPQQAPAVARVSVEQPSVPQAAPLKQTKPQEKVETPARKHYSPSRNQGILYSGIPVFFIADQFKKLFSFFREHHEIRTHKKAKIEESDLHENNVHPVYQEASPIEVSDAEDIFSATQNEPIAVERDGYKLTMEDEHAVEHTLRNVKLSVNPLLEKFSSKYNRLSFTKDHIFELRNQVLEPIRPDHFFFALNLADGALETLIKGASVLKMARPLRIKIQRGASPQKVLSLKLYADDSLTDFVVADVDAKMLAGLADKESSDIYLVHRNDNLYFVDSKTGEETLLEKYVVRLPKEESKYWLKIFDNNPEKEFSLNIFSTKDKTFAWTYLVPSMQIGLGKTMAPELSSRTQLGESTASMIMLGINNVLPVFMGFVHKGLKRYGEAAVGRIGVGSFVLGAAVALASGLYGNLGDSLMTSWQTVGFVTSSLLIAIGTNITRFVQNILISANRGKIVAQDSFKDPDVSVSTTSGQKVVYNMAHLKKRTKEVFTKSPTGSARDIVLFQTASMFKNLGTMLFLSFPWMVNGLVKLTTGIDLNLDFSASYVPYSLFGAWTLYKVCRTAYKDSFPTKLNLLNNSLQETKQQAFKDILRLKPEEITAENPVVINAAKQIKGAIDAISPVEARETGKKIADISERYKEDIPLSLAEQIGVKTAEDVSLGQTAAVALKEAIDNLGRRSVSVFDVMKLPGLPASLTAMTLATFHELAISNGFAFGMRSIVGHGATANALTALALYGTMSAGRILGNMLSRRVSGGTMYTISSSMSLIGTALMAAANGNLATFISGAVFASFGMGNFFSQMYEYMTGLYPKYRREITLLISYTMPLAAIITFPMRWMVNTTGIGNLDLLISGAGFLASLVLTPGMFANSSIVKAIRYGMGNLKASVNQVVNRIIPSSSSQTDGSALLHEGENLPQSPEEPTDMGEPLAE